MYGTSDTFGVMGQRVFIRAERPFERRTHKRLIDIINPNQATIEALTTLDLPAGVEFEVKL